MSLTFERSEHTEAVVKILRKVNGEASYMTLASQSKLPVARLKSVLSSARRILKRDKILFGVVIGQGLKRLSDQDKVVKSESTKKRMARTADRGIKDLETIEQFERLSQTDQLKVTTNRTILNLTRQQLRVKAVPPPEPMATPEIPNVTTLARLHK